MLQQKHNIFVDADESILQIAPIWPPWCNLHLGKKAVDLTVGDAYMRSYVSQICFDRNQWNLATTVKTLHSGKRDERM